MSAEIAEHRCLACGEPADYCQGHGDLIPCDDCIGWSLRHDFVPARFTGNIVCSRCSLLPLDSEDYESACLGGYHEEDCHYNQ